MLGGRGGKAPTGCLEAGSSPMRQEPRRLACHGHSIPASRTWPDAVPRHRGAWIAGGVRL